MFRAIWEMEGRAEAYALYRVKGEWTDSMPAGALIVKEAIATTARATHAIWRFLLGVDLVARVMAPFAPVDHPLFYMVTEPRRLHIKAKDGLWLRVVDAKSALEARSYALEASLCFELAAGGFTARSGVVPHRRARRARVGSRRSRRRLPGRGELHRAGGGGTGRGTGRWGGSEGNAHVRERAHGVVPRGLLRLSSRVRDAAEVNPSAAPAR